MQVKWDGQSRDYQLLVRQVQMKPSQKEKFEWVGLTTGQAESRSYHFTADLYRGFVSLEYLKSLDNTYSTGVKLRSKHLVFISHE